MVTVQEEIITTVDSLPTKPEQHTMVEEVMDEGIYVQIFLLCPFRGGGATPCTIVTQPLANSVALFDPVQTQPFSIVIKSGAILTMEIFFRSSKGSPFCKKYQAAAFDGLLLLVAFSQYLFLFVYHKTHICWTLTTFPPHLKTVRRSSTQARS